MHIAVEPGSCVQASAHQGGAFIELALRLRLTGQAVFSAADKTEPVSVSRRLDGGGRAVQRRDSGPRNLARHKDRTAPNLGADDHAVFYTVGQYLKHTNLSHEEILPGIVDGEKDCGIDAVYLFANGLCVRDDLPLAALGKSVRLELVLMQVKNTAGFGEDAINKLIANLPKILSFDRDETVLCRSVNPRLLEATRRFLSAYRELDMPELSMFVAFASLKATDLHPNTAAKAGELETCIRNLFGGATVASTFIDARVICDMARETPSSNRSLVLAENPISTDTAGGYIGVVRLSDYQDFITSPTGELDASLFEANVRDYEGDTTVNRSIQETLSKKDVDVDFWWLNNGVTIVATEVQPANKLLKLVSPQIVNGLQTSTEIYKRERTTPGDDGRSVLVKVIEAREPNVRDRIIRATNSQTAFGPSALKATDRVQRQIEEHLLAQGLYYERRRRHYLNQSIPIDKIVTIDQMGQAVLSVLVQVSHIARGQLRRVYEQDIYEAMFHHDYPVQAYASCIGLVRSCATYLSKSGLADSADDFLFQLATLSGIPITRHDKPSPRDLIPLEGATMDNALATELLEMIQRQYERVTRRGGAVLLDQLAKDGEVTAALIADAKVYLRSSPRAR